MRVVMLKPCYHRYKILKDIQSGGWLHGFYQKYLFYVFPSSDGKQSCLSILQDGRIDYNEFVAMMQKGTVAVPAAKKGLQSSFSIGFREALKL